MQTCRQHEAKISWFFSPEQAHYLCLARQQIFAHNKCLDISTITCGNSGFNFWLDQFNINYFNFFSSLFNFYIGNSAVFNSPLIWASFLLIIIGIALCFRGFSSRTTENTDTETALRLRSSQCYGISRYKNIFHKSN